MNTNIATKIFKTILFILAIVYTCIGVGAETLADHASVSLAFMPPIFLFFDVTLLKAKTTMSTSGGGYTSFRWAPKDYFDSIPLPDPTNKGKIVGDYIFKAGKDWIYIYTDDHEFDLTETPSDVRNNDGYTTELKGMCPGENSYIRQAINEGVLTIDGYALLDNCNEISTIALGKGKCCPATLKLTFKSGKKTSDVKGWEFSVKCEQNGVACHYEGVGAMNAEYAIAADDATPDVSKGTATYLLGANTEATAITGLDNAVQGSLITFKWTSATNASTIANGATFQLSAAFTPSVGAILVLQATTSSTFAERYRYIPA